MSALLCLALLSCIELALQGCVQAHPFVRVVVTFFSFIKIVHFINLFGILKLDRTDRLSPTCKLEPTASSRFRSALHLAMSTRGIGTKWQIRGLPTWPPTLEAPGKADFRARFLARQAVVVAWQYMAWDIVYNGVLLECARTQSHLYRPESDYLGFSTTAGQVRIRIIVAGVFVCGVLFVVDMLYRLASITEVSLNLTQWDDWPPLFGDIKDAYTVTRFWGKFWHQLIRWPMVSFVKWVRNDVLHIPTLSSGDRFIDAVILFNLSGILHYVSVAGSGMDEPQWGTVYFFMVQPLAMLLENSLSSWVRPRCWQRVIGYAWVWLWLNITAPWFGFPSMRLPVEKSLFMPYSFVEDLGLARMKVFAALLGLAISV
ncbi:hypothetical protein BO86DRAFT_303106 [Aspergillus japonicus CBS 114.51]|uniref:Wax synthase domain-containing protein n=1 Tax=Aspergillus japonicus CBS 114.51 TaxID=1448312 RepID=A0A8T8XFZ5_ASPJA|nr:hypothetical protein BO86DRAFT_303106 [Aspergillus japonicus CBS 114.51]RAH86212.1 hypothetical protein BO86DRAFT_303106 [Aspergillus japonicus CBS 114.51]